MTFMELLKKGPFFLDGGFGTLVQKAGLKPGEAPEAVFALAAGEAPVAAYEYCNLHGLWKAEA